uniref:Uncharacterized protein n=1 Tax=Astyanax mexicanus TaxID=7994 RepID=A0A3B1ITB7_ASTMX
HLNQIEHLWRDLKMAVYQCSPSNLTKLERTCLKEFQRIPKSRCEKLASFLRRLMAVLAQQAVPATANVPVSAVPATAHVPMPAVPTANVPVPAVPTANVPVPAVPTANVPVPAVPTANVPVPAVPTANVPVPAVPTANVPVPAVPTANVPVPAVPTAYVPVPAVPTAPATMSRLLCFPASPCRRPPGFVVTRLGSCAFREGLLLRPRYVFLCFPRFLVCFSCTFPLRVCNL